VFIIIAATAAMSRASLNEERYHQRKDQVSCPMDCQFLRSCGPLNSVNDLFRIKENILISYDI
jgi:hypothetical protein